MDSFAGTSAIHAVPRAKPVIRLPRASAPQMPSIKATTAGYSVRRRSIGTPVAVAQIRSIAMITRMVIHSSTGHLGQMPEALNPRGMAFSDAAYIRLFFFKQKTAYEM